MVNGAVDFLMMPGKNGSNNSGGDSAMDAVQELATTIVEGVQGDTFRVEGRVRPDPGFNNENRNFLAKIKSAYALQDAREQMFDIHDEVWNGFKSTLQTLLVGHEGWGMTRFNLYFQGGRLPELLRRTEDTYMALLQEAERMCTGGEWDDDVELFLTHHADKLGFIRRIGARNRIQLIWKKLYLSSERPSHMLYESGSV